MLFVGAVVAVVVIWGVAVLTGNLGNPYEGYLAGASTARPAYDPNLKPNVFGGAGE